MNVLVSIFAIVVSALTITQGVRTLSYGARLRDRIAKDVAIYKDMPAGPVRDEMAELIRTATARLVVTERHRPDWYVLPVAVISSSFATGIVAYIWLSYDSSTWVATAVAVSNWVSAGTILQIERSRLETRRRPMLERLQADTSMPDDAPA